MKNINIEAEGGELILKNKAGDYVIIPKDRRSEVRALLKSNCNSCIDAIVNTLPSMSNYAPDGTVIPGQRVSNFRATDSSANTMSASQYEQARLAEAQRIEDQRILAERRARLARSKAAKGKPLSAQQIADESAAIGDKLRAFPDDPNSIIDALNPAVLVGDLASGLGQVPLNIQEGNYGQAAMNVAAPLVTGALLGGRNAADLANNLVNPLAGVRLKAPVSISKKLNSIGKPTFDIQELRNAYHNSSRSLSSSEMEYLNEKGFGRMSEYLAPSNQLPEPPNSINGLPFFVKDSLIRRGLSREERRAALNSFVSNSEARKNAFKQPSDFINRSGLTKKEALEKVSPKDKEAVAKMSEEEFSKTVLKPTGELVQYKKSQDLDNITYSFDTYGYMLKDQTPISTEEYISRFNKDIGLLNDIINKRNKSGVKYEATELKPIGLYDGALSFNTPKQRVPINPSKEDLAELEFFNRNPLKALKDLAGVKKVGNSYVFPNGMTFNSEDELIKFGREKIQENLGTKEIGGYSNFYTKINPGEWRGTVEDIPSTEYLRAIPGLEMSVTSNTVFSDRIPRKGTGAYESINDYLKQINLGRVKAGFNSQTPFSKGAWENFIKSGRAVGFYNDPNTVYSAMRTVLPVTAAAAASQEFKYGGMIKKADGTVIPGPFPSWLNPKNWGVTDYSDKGDFNSAFFAAKKAGEKEFMYNNKRYNTKSDLTPDQQMKAYGITDKQRVLNPSTYRKNLSNLNTADGYDTPVSDIVNRALGKNEGEDFSSEPSSPIAKEQDALRLYLGLPQKANTFRPSRYKKDAFELTGYNEMLPDEMPSDEEINFYGKPLSQDDFIKTKGSLKNVKVAENYSGNTLKPLEDFVMGKHTVRKGKDDRGEYIEYIDNFDFDTYKYNNIPVGEIGDKFNKPYSIYGRKYYKDYGDGVKKAMYYTDKELSELDIDKKNFDTLALQRELGNRGYKLPKSTKKDGKFDGVWGDETKNALLEYQRLQGVQEFKYGGMIKRADGTYSRRGLWDNIRANRGSGKEPTKEMLEQEKKIKAEDGMIVPQQNFFEESINTLPSMSRTTGTPFKNPGTGSITPAQKQSDIGKPFEYKGCVGGMCAGLARDNKMALKDFRKLNNLYGDAWEIADNMYGQGVDLSNYSNLRVGDIINMSRETFKSDKARGIPSSNQHVGYVSKIENGIPYVKHYIPNTGVMKKMDGDKEVKVPYGEYFEEPINNISAKYKYTATGASRLDWTREIDKKPSEFKFDRGYMPNKIEKAFMDVHNQKPDIQEKLKLTSDEYEQLSRVAYGIMGAESNYGKSIKTAYRMLVPDKYQEKIKIARDFLTGEEHGYDENINTLSRGYASLKSSTLYNIQDNNVNELQDIQRKVGVKPDGLYGPATKKAIEQYNAKNPNNPIKYRSVEERVREGDFEGLDKSGNYLYYALNRLGVDDKDLDSPEASTKALIATLAWHKKNNPNATDDDLIKAYTGKKNITNYKTVYDKYARNIDKIYGNSATPDMLTSVWENILTDVSLAGNETRKNFKKVTSAIASAVRDVAPLPIPVTAILGDIYGAKGDFTEKSLTSYTEDKLKEIVARQVKQGKYTLDYNAYFPEMSREDRLAISGGGGGSSSGMSKVAKLFSPEGMLQNFLGQAVIKPLGNGEYEIRDTYDFNDAGESFGVMEDLKRRGPDPYSIFRSLGRNYGSKDGLGAKVRIRIKLDN